MHYEALGKRLGGYKPALLETDLHTNAPSLRPLQRFPGAGDALRARLGLLGPVFEGQAPLGAHARGLDLLSARHLLQFPAFGTLRSYSILFL